ncbi:MAG: hypothetical protein GOVbin5978_49 [Prokaryotic dsDNA virus sp.]|nr:MAG: hypothetical protein GOVbin5978_49 [Prokaryotic dsDNA virus sp.]|tara:strand:- start:15306 stop:15971 length:666 start_codon:yes stop_codon:yes gene_type:complete
MKTIIVNDKEIDVPTGWHNIRFDKFNEFSKLVNSQKTQEQFNEENSHLDEYIRELEWSLENVRMNTKLACFWTGLPEEEISMCNIETIEEILKSMDFMNESYVPVAIDKFKFKGFEYFLPKPGMKGENFGTYIETEQVEINNKRLEKGDLSVLPKQIAILCKRKGEERGLVNDEVIKKRAAAFRKLDMATIWDVGFFLTQHESSLMTLFLTSLIQEQTEKQ